MGRKITELTAVSGLRPTDVIHLVDILDTNMAGGTGTNKKITIKNFVPSLLEQMDLIPSSKITGQAVTTEKIALSAITTDRIALSAVTTAKIALSAVTTEVINNGAVTTDKIALSAVTTDRINNGVVTTDKIALSAVTTEKIALSAVTQTRLAANVVGNGPAFRAYATVPTSISSQTYTQVTLSAVRDTNSNFATSRFTPTVAGYYLISGQVYTTTASTGLLASIAKNNAQHSLGSQVSASSLRSVVSDIVYLDGTGDFVALHAYSGGATTIQNNSGIDTYFSGCLIRSA